MQERSFPHRIGRYLLLEPLGSGAMGSVYLAAPESLPRQRFALKTMHPTLAGDQAFAARFRREAELASRLSHPNLVPVVDFGTEDGLPFLVMLYVAGVSLRDVIMREAPLGRERIASIVRQLALALAHVHENGLVHRDVKPANIILTSEDGREVPKLLDFGMVGLLNSETVGRLTAEGTTVGTPLYMAPEQILDPQVGPVADLYALGVVLYEMLSGKPPFSGDAHTIIAAKLASDPPPLAERTGLEPLAWRLLAPHPDDRIRSARELVTAIDAVVGRESPAPVPVPAPVPAPVLAPDVITQPVPVDSPSSEAKAGFVRRGVIAATLFGAAAAGAAAAWLAGGR